MTKEQLVEKVNELIENSNKSMRNNLNDLLKMEMLLDLDKYDNDYLFPRIVFGALLKEEEFQYKPHTKEEQKLINSVYRRL